MGVIAVWSVWHNWRDMWKQPPSAGSIDFILWLAPKRWWGLPRTVVMTLLAVLTCLVFVSFISKLLMEQLQSGRASWAHVLTQLIFAGMVVSSSLRWLIPQPVRFCTAGVLMGKTAIPWAHIRSAEWAWSRPGVLRLHRLDGDLYAAAPRVLGAEVETYLRQRTQFIGRSTMNAAAHDLAPGH